MILSQIVADIKRLCCAKYVFFFLRTIAVISQWVGIFWNLYEFEVADYQVEGFCFVFLVFPGFMLLLELAFSYQRYCSDQSSVLTMEYSRKLLPR